MPGNVSLATVTSVMPFGLCKSFKRQRLYAMRSNYYADGRSERNSLVESDRSTWVLGNRLTAAVMNELQSFYLLQQGSVVPFFYYDPWDATFTYDPSGSQTPGRYSVRFQGSLQITGSIPRAETQLTLVEIA